MFLLIPEKPVLFILLDEFALYSSFGNFFNVWLKKGQNKKSEGLSIKFFLRSFTKIFSKRLSGNLLNALGKLFC